jgi:glycosyltransferase involved in cell wall biosynthesis
MKVVHLGTADWGGAATAAWTVHHGLKKRGHQSLMFVGHRISTDPDVCRLPLSGCGFRLKRKFYNRLGLPERAFRARSRAFIELPAVREADIVTLHNLHGSFFDYRVLPDLCGRKPVIWALHDMWALTGFCAYSFDCARWETECHECPQYRCDVRERRKLDIQPLGLDNTRLAWRTKRDVYRRSRLHIAVACEWMKKQVEKSILKTAASLTVIHDGVDTSLFAPIGRDFARQALGLPPTTPIILAFPRPGRKGGEHLLAALARLAVKETPLIVSVGNPTILRDEQNRFPVHYVGHVHSDPIMRLFYNAADIFVLPTLADNVPLSLTAALACGLPSVAYDSGGVSEVVAHMTTGYLARHADIDDLVLGIKTLLENDTLRRDLARSARDLALNKFTLEATTAGYLSLYGQLLRDAAGGQG